MRHVILGLLAIGCGDVADGKPAPAPAARHAIAHPADVRWPLERRSFAGTIRAVPPPASAAAIPMLAIEGGPTLLVAVHAASPALHRQLVPGTQLRLSGIGRAPDRDERAAGALLALGDVRIENDAGRAALRSTADVHVALAETRVRAMGVLIEHASPRPFALRLAAGVEIPILVTVDGVENARARVGDRVELEGALRLRYPMDVQPGDRPGLAISSPVFRRATR